MLATLIPMFDKNMIVMGYSVFAQRDNLLLDPIKSGSGYLDSAMRIEGMEPPDVAEKSLPSISC